MKHIVVYGQSRIFAGWPANNGVWDWNGQEILVGLTVGAFEEKPGHNISEPYRSVLARSINQGDSWMLVEPRNFVGGDMESRAVLNEVDFTHPGFAMRVVGTGYHGSDRSAGAFLISTDRGAGWAGPYSFDGLMACHDLEGLEITARTDYVIEGPRQCLLLMSARGGALKIDRTFCARTTDGGRSFHFVSWVVPPSDPYRAVMPATVRYSSGELIAVVRRREPGTERCWIDAYRSTDAGRRWSWCGHVANTGGWNGNPPALAITAGGKLCCVFGERDTCRMIAKFSTDRGATWHGNLILRDDFQRDRFDDPDLGYARVVRRADGKMVACYYWATTRLPHQHIAATIWDPDADADPGIPGVASILE